MKSNFIKVIAIFLVMLTVFSVPSIAYEKQLTEITTTLFADENGTTAEPTKPTEPTEP